MHRSHHSVEALVTVTCECSFANQTNGKTLESNVTSTSLMQQQLLLLQVPIVLALRLACGQTKDLWSGCANTGGSEYK